MTNIIAWFSGRKTYILAGLTVAYGILGWCLGHLTQDQSIQVILTGLSVFSLRVGVKKSGPTAQ
jgi:hypothetical protein